MKSLIWPFNILALSPAYKKLFPRGSHLRECLEIGLAALNERLEIDPDKLKIAEETAKISDKTIREYARAHILAFQFLGPQREILEQKLKDARERKIMPASLRGVECLVAGGIESWAQIARVIVESCAGEIAKLQKDRIRKSTKNLKEERQRAELIEGANERLREELETCQKERDDLKRIRDELRQILVSFLKQFNRNPLKEVADLLEYFSLLSIFPEESDELRGSAEEILHIEANLIRPTAILFGFPEKSNSGRAIKYEQEFLLQAAKAFSTSRNGMSALRHSLALFGQNLDVKNPKQAKTKLPFSLPTGFENRDAYVFPVSDRWLVFYVFRRLEKRGRATICSLQRSVK